METPKVYEAINLVMMDISKTGIAKANQNQQQRYNFRGIDDVYNALAPIMANHGLMTLPRVLSREVTERQTNNGKPLFYTVVEVEYDFVCVADGSKHTIKVSGEAMDMADKSTNKAMAAAHKYACLQAFCIPTQGDNDADLTTYEVAANQTPVNPALLQAIESGKADVVATVWNSLGKAARGDAWNNPSLTDSQRDVITKAVEQFNQKQKVS